MSLNLATTLRAHSLPKTPLIFRVSLFNLPPIKKSSSARITFAPELAAVNAADSPEAPAPMMRISQ